MAAVREVMEGLQILDSVGRAKICAEHDITYVHVDQDISEANVKVLEELGWHWSTEGDCWAIFV